MPKERAKAAVNVCIDKTFSWRTSPGLRRNFCYVVEVGFLDVTCATCLECAR